LSLTTNYVFEKNDDKDVCIRNEKMTRTKPEANNKAKLEQTRPATRKIQKLKLKIKTKK